MGTLTSSPGALSKLVCDRFFYSEFVYGPLMRGKVSLTKHQQEVIHSMLITAEPLVIQCHLIKDEEEFNSRPQHFDWATTLKTEALFDGVLGQGSAFQYRALDSLSYSVFNQVTAYLEMMEDWREFRSKVAYGRGQMRSPQLMIVGEKFSRDNKWKVPFERSKSGIILHNALRLTGFTMEGLWFTNAVKTPEPLNPINLSMLEREVELIQPKRVIGLGNRASGLLSSLGIDHTKIRHPGWYIRKYRAEEATKEFEVEFAIQMGLEFVLQASLDSEEMRKST
jgi:uracil-DNA glycosylase family 4